MNSGSFSVALVSGMPMWAHSPSVRTSTRMAPCLQLGPGLLRAEVSGVAHAWPSNASSAKSVEVEVIHRVGHGGVGAGDRGRQDHGLRHDHAAAVERGGRASVQDVALGQGRRDALAEGAVIGAGEQAVGQLLLGGRPGPAGAGAGAVGDSGADASGTTDLLLSRLQLELVDMPSIHLRHPAAKGRVADRPVRAWRRFSLLPKNVTPTTPARTAAVVMFRNGTTRNAAVNHGANAGSFAASA